MILRHGGPVPGRYDIVEVIGSGAQATVCAARVRGGSDELVALKAVLPDLARDKEVVARVRDEARILMRLRHPSIIQVHRLLDYDGRPVMELEHVDGVSLEALLRQQPEGLYFPAILEVARRVAAALDAAYNAPVGPRATPMRIIHRDLKPGNILIAPSGEVKLVDFGVAKGDFVDRTAKSIANIRGTAGYTSPERLLDGADSPAGDVYALGATLFALVTGKELNLTLDPRKRVEMARRQLEFVAPRGLADPAPLRDLIFATISFLPTDRLPIDEVSAQIAALQEKQGYARSTKPMGQQSRGLRSVRRVPAKEHPGYADVAFLERDDPSESGPRLDPAACETEVRRLLAQPGWEERVVDIERVLDRSDAGADAPLFEILRRAERSWWQVWSKPATAREIESALWLLARHPTDVAAKLAAPLAAHDDDRVKKLARWLIDSAAARNASPR